MLAVTVVAVGKLRDAYLREAVAEYQKRLGAFFRFTVVEVEEARLPQNPSDAEIRQALEREAGAILEKLPPRAFVAALCIEGRLFSSEQLAARIESAGQEASHLAFVIGSSHGLAARVKERANLSLSLSPMTFPHGLARVMLCEQLYRAASINAGGKYHK